MSKFYYDADNFKACIDCCNKLLLNANYQTFNLYYRRGLAHFELGNYKATLDDLTNAIKMAISSGANHPQLADGYNMRAEALRQLNNYKQSVLDSDAAIRLKPKEESFYITRAVTKSCMTLLEMKEALEDYAYIISKLNANSKTAYAGMSYVYTQLGFYDDAVKAADKAIALDANYSRAYKNRGLAKRQLGRYQEAIEDFNKF